MRVIYALCNSGKGIRKLRLYVSRYLSLNSMVHIYDIIHNYLFSNLLLYSTITLYISFNLTFQRAVKLVELISSSSHAVATQSSIKLIKYAC